MQRDNFQKEVLSQKTSKILLITKRHIVNDLTFALNYCISYKHTTIRTISVNPKRSKWNSFKTLLSLVMASKRFWSVVSVVQLWWDYIDYGQTKGTIMWLRWDNVQLGNNHEECIRQEQKQTRFKQKKNSLIFAAT